MLSERVTAVGPGQSFVAGGLQVRTYGGQHALIHSSIPVVANVGYLVGDAVYHPGDSYVVPNAVVEALLVPINAPWSKLAETIDFTISVRAPRAFQIHDGLLNDPGRGLYESQLDRAGQLYGITRFQHLDAGRERAAMSEHRSERSERGAQRMTSAVSEHRSERQRVRSAAND